MYDPNELYVGILQVFADSRLLAYSPRKSDPYAPREVVRLPSLPKNHTGEAHHQTRLTDADVVAMRASPASHAELARQYGVTRENVRLIRLRLSRRNVPGVWHKPNTESRGGRREGAGRKAA